MVDQKKVILMSKLAIEEKKYTRKDRAITDYYPEDYIYVNNFKTRIIMLVIVGVISAAIIMYKINSGLNIPITINEWMSEYILPYGGFILGTLVIYSAISTTVYTSHYKHAEKRKITYHKLLKELEHYEK